MISISRSVLCLILLFACGVSSANTRVWRDKDGNSFVGEYVREQFDKFYFRGPDKKMVTVAVDKISEIDLTYIRTMVVPDVEVTAKVKDKLAEFPPEATKSGGNSDFRMYDLFSDITVTKKGKSSFQGVLRGEFYLIGDEVRSDDYRLLLKDTFVVRFKDGENRFEYKTVGQALEVETFVGGTYRGNVYKGFLACVYAPDGKLLSHDTNLGFLKEEEKVEMLSKLNVGNFFREECRKVSTPRPRDYEFSSYGTPNTGL